MDGAKVNYFFNLLQVKTKKITAKDENLTFAIIKTLFSSDMSNPADTTKKISIPFSALLSLESKNMSVFLF
jgi:hypothetical protein